MRFLSKLPLCSLSIRSPPTDSKSTSDKNKVAPRRTFQFVGYGSSLDEELRSKHDTISCDGRIEGGVTLELTHWNGNGTPESLYADTSTEMALNLPNDMYPDALVLNNHFDTDGVLSVFACLQPELARSYSELLKEGAAAGDFGEWSSDRGIMLNAILEGMCSECSTEEEGYHKALQALPGLLQDLALHDDKPHEAFWKPVLDDAYAGLEAIERGSVKLEPWSSRFVVCYEEDTGGWMSSYALHRGLVEKGCHRDCNRILRVRSGSLGNKNTLQTWKYHYEKPGHGWVGRLNDRRPIPNFAEGDKSAVQTLVDTLNSKTSTGVWNKGGSSLVSICHGLDVNVPVEEVVELLAAWEGPEICGTKGD